MNLHLLSIFFLSIPFYTHQLIRAVKFARSMDGVGENLTKYHAGGADVPRGDDLHVDTMDSDTKRSSIAEMGGNIAPYPHRPGPDVHGNVPPPPTKTQVQDVEEKKARNVHRKGDPAEEAKRQSREADVRRLYGASVIAKE